jgi:hypothetical protein
LSPPLSLSLSLRVGVARGLIRHHGSFQCAPHLSRIKKPICGHTASLLYSICKPKSMNSEARMQLTLLNRTIANNTTQIGAFNSLKQSVKFLHGLTLNYPAYSASYTDRILRGFSWFGSKTKIDCSHKHHYPADQESGFS